MNANDLKRFVDFILEREKLFKIQNNLGQIRDLISNIVSNPGNSDFQNQFSQSYSTLKRAIIGFSESITPAQWVKIAELGGERFFSESIVSRIDKQISENSITPAVVRDYLSNLFGIRQEFLDNLNQLSVSLSAVGVTDSEISAGEAEIGLTLPRVLFHNRLDEFNVQLRRFDLVFRNMSEAATGHVEHATVGDLSSSDPTMFFGLSPETIAQIANGFKWAIDTLSSIAKLKESIESLRGQGLKKSQLKGVEDAVDEKIAAAVDAKVKEIMAQKPHPDERVAELEKGVKWSLEYVMAAVERGVTVELRFLPPPPPAGDVPPDEAQAAAFEKLSQASKELLFAAPSQEPMLALPNPEPPTDGD